MKLYYLVCLLLSLSLRSPGQVPSNSFSFPSSASTPTTTHFGIEGQAFPDTSSRGVTSQAFPSMNRSVGTMPYAYSVRPQRFEQKTRGDLTSPSALAWEPLNLIFKDYTSDSALTYWVAGKTLHYTDPYSNSKMVPLKRVNWKLTRIANSVKQKTR